MHHPRNSSPTETIALQLLAARMQLLWKSYHTDGLLDAVQMLTLLFLLVIRGSLFRDVPVEPWDSVDLVRSCHALFFPSYTHNFTCHTFSVVSSVATTHHNYDVYHHRLAVSPRSNQSRPCAPRCSGISPRSTRVCFPTCSCSALPPSSCAKA